MLDRTSTCSVCIATLTLDDWIYDCLLTAMATVQAADARASFLFVGDLNGHHQELLGSTIPRTVMVLLPSILPLCQVVINW